MKRIPLKKNLNKQMNKKTLLHKILKKSKVIMYKNLDLKTYHKMMTMN